MASPTINFAPPEVKPLPSPPSSPDSDSTVIIAVFVSFGSLLFLGFLLVALCCFIKWRKNKNTQETDIISGDEHLKVKEAFAPGPHGSQAVAISIEDDIHTNEMIRKMRSTKKAYMQNLLMRFRLEDPPVQAITSSSTRPKFKLRSCRACPCLAK
ncbi:hypothetical protein RJ639_038552 [Escallonia herrerae]|uniref:Uncharacterized protein n=1 Tax=Escallonia herrerae TaxID=1293975 RepID=A0AA88WKG6_9ASTE|nr:hypothetical protein RJ639_038552 [Escallonia herrerae]